MKLFQWFAIIIYVIQKGLHAGITCYIITIKEYTSIVVETCDKKKKKNLLEMNARGKNKSDFSYKPSLRKKKHSNHETFSNVRRLKATIYYNMCRSIVRVGTTRQFNRIFCSGGPKTNFFLGGGG